MSLFTTITIGGFNPIAASFGALGLLTALAFIYLGLNDPTSESSNTTERKTVKIEKKRKGLFG